MTTVPVRTSSLTPYGSQERDERVDLGLRAGRLDDDRRLGDVDDPRPVELDDPHDLAAVGVGRPDLDQGQLVLDRSARRSGPGP